jgi:transposase InsO family protein
LDVCREAPQALRPVVERPTERWAMDFVHDTLADGRTLRVLAIVDVFSRECVGLVARPRFSGHDVATLLNEAGADGGLPATIQVDNGSEFTSKALDHWAYWKRGCIAPLSVECVSHSCQMSQSRPRSRSRPPKIGSGQHRVEIAHFRRLKLHTEQKGPTSRARVSWAWKKTRCRSC